MGEQVAYCVIVGAAPYHQASFYRDIVKEALYIVAADGGTRLLDELGCSADLIVGDFDSSKQPQGGTRTIVLPTRKDDTDVLAAMRIALQKGYCRFVLIGCMGGRFDHTIANLFVLRFAMDHGAVATLVDEHHSVSLLSAGSHTLQVEPNRYVSLFPYGGEVEDLTVSGAKYETDHTTLTMSFPVGVSNEFASSPMEISFRKGYVLLVLADKY